MGFATQSAAITTLVLMSAAVVVPDTAEAYIDPGSASYIFQAIIGTILGGVFLIRTYWARLRSMLFSEPVEPRKGE